MSRLVPRHLPRHGRVWSAARDASDLSKLAHEVSEYFALGLELPRDARIVDVGANCGLFAIEVAVRAPGASIVAIEPIPIFHRALAKNFAENAHLSKLRDRSKIVRSGIAKDETETEAEFAYFSRLPTDTTRYVDGKYDEFERVFATHAGTIERGIRSVIPNGVGMRVSRVAHDWVAGIPRGGVRGWVFDRLIGIERVRCPMTTLARVLDDVAAPVDVLKVDVEGAELDVLLGARPEQWRSIRQVVLEGNDKNGTLTRIRELLASHGLTSQRIGEPNGSAAQGLDSFLLYASR